MDILNNFAIKVNRKEHKYFKKFIYWLNQTYRTDYEWNASVWAYYWVKNNIHFCEDSNKWCEIITLDEWYNIINKPVNYNITIKIWKKTI